MVQSTQGVMPCVDHLYLYQVLALLQRTGNLYFVGCRPGNATVLAVHPDVGDILDLRQ